MSLYFLKKSANRWTTERIFLLFQTPPQSKHQLFPLHKREHIQDYHPLHQKGLCQISSTLISYHIVKAQRAYIIHRVNILSDYETKAKFSTLFLIYPLSTSTQ